MTATVLLVDPAPLELPFAPALAAEGYELLTAEDPAAALRVLSRRRVDVVIGSAAFAGDRGVQRQADELLEAVAGAERIATTDLRFGGALMTDPSSPGGAAIVRGTLEPTWVRWWTIAGALPGYCGNPREILFGVDPGRRDVLKAGGVCYQGGGHGLLLSQDRAEFKRRSDREQAAERD